jgi:hypothetical protein
MSLTMYDASAPVFRRMLVNLSQILAKAEVHAAQNGLDPAELVQARLYPDMFPLVRQVQIASDVSKGAVARLAGIEPPKMADEEQTFEDVRGRIERTLAFIAEAPRVEIEGSASRKIEIKVGGQELAFSGKDYLLTFALPNFFFHITTAYDILRHTGLDIGKRDFLGA